MNSFQRTIKYIAIGFAFFLAIIIISAMIKVGAKLASFISGGMVANKVESFEFTDVFTGVKSVEINNSNGKLSILEGETLKVEAENVSENFHAKVSNNGTLKILDNNQRVRFFGFDLEEGNTPNSTITVYLPKDFLAEEIKLDTGAGNVEIDGVETKYLRIMAGAGNIDGTNITAEKVKLNGGVGNVKLKNINFNNSDFDCGIGNITIEGILLGKNKFDGGVGDVNLYLTGDINDYDIDVDDGVGNIRLNGERISRDYSNNNNSPNSIDIDGGVGNVTIEITR